MQLQCIGILSISALVQLLCIALACVYSSYCNTAQCSWPIQITDAQVHWCIWFSWCISVYWHCTGLQAKNYGFCFGAGVIRIKWLPPRCPLLFFKILFLWNIPFLRIAYQYYKYCEGQSWILRAILIRIKRLACRCPFLFFKIFFLQNIPYLRIAYQNLEATLWWAILILEGDCFQN